ncbi:MAG TPA: TIGR03560 family F420-dependent LLM class oxidoreductase [Thermoleophilaceae bacterium]|nr:TIGR03560 family F420-dependent LLM class oxidoreductase [Thermoleophilaceae bacterium]
MRAPIELDLHLPNFNYPGVGPDQVFDRLVDIATTAERAGFSAVTLMDHYHQIPPVGPQENWMFEGNTMLAGIAARTQTIGLGLLVGGVTYRNPAQHAKITTTLDVISGGRAFHGIGAGWFEGEHDAYGYAFPPLRERFELLEDHLRIARAMFKDGQATVAGDHNSVTAAYNNPKPLRGDIPILIGGSGERKTLRMVAQYADGCNVFGDPERARHLLGVLEGHCERLGRDPAEITKTSMANIAIAESDEAVRAKLEAMLAAGVPKRRVQAATAGTPDRILERAHAFREVGIEGLTITMPDAHDLDSVALAGETLAPVFNPEG